MLHPVPGVGQANNGLVIGANQQVPQRLCSSGDYEREVFTETCVPQQDVDYFSHLIAESSFSGFPCGLRPEAIHKAHLSPFTHPRQWAGKTHPKTRPTNLATSASGLRRRLTRGGNAPSATILGLLSPWAASRYSARAANFWHERYGLLLSMATRGGSPPASVMACWFLVTTARFPRVTAASRAHFSSADPARAKMVRRSSALKTPTWVVECVCVCVCVFPSFCRLVGQCGWARLRLFFEAFLRRSICAQPYPTGGSISFLNEGETSTWGCCLAS